MVTGWLPVNAQVGLGRLHQVCASPLFGALAAGAGAAVGAGRGLHVPHLQAAVLASNICFGSCEIPAKSPSPVLSLRSARLRAVPATASQSHSGIDAVCSGVLYDGSAAGPGDGKVQTDH